MKGLLEDAGVDAVAPFTGAWIEMIKVQTGRDWPGMSHPSRVRGLKLRYLPLWACFVVRRTLHGCVD